MAASVNDNLMKVGLATATTLDANYTINDGTLTVVSTSGMPTDTGITVAIDVIDSTGVQVAGTYNEYVCTVASATSLANVDWADGSGDRNYSAGATTRVYIPVSKTRENRIVDWGLVEHDQDGTHSDITATSITATTGTFTNLTIAGTASAEGWSPLGATPNTVTANGNRSYDLVFNGTDLTDTITEGMRVRTARTVAAPIQCATFDGTNDYFSKSSPNGMTFTDDFVVSAWVKLSSYPVGSQGAVVSRYNGTSGWEMKISTDGTVQLVGYNAGAANNSYVQSYQSIPLNKWVHISAQLDMSAFTATTTTSYVMIDGVDVPAKVVRNGTNPTALVQAGNLEIGTSNAILFFPGKIAQVAIYSAKVTQATIKASMNQGLSGSETSLISAYSFNNSINDLNTGNANNLTANGGVLATTADSPFGNSGVSTTIDYGIVMAKSFSTNTTLTVQVPEGCTIPTSGGVSGMYYSINDVPYGFPKAKGKWVVGALWKTTLGQNSPTINVWYNLTPTSGTAGGTKLKIPTGEWGVTYSASLYNENSAQPTSPFSTLSTGAATESDTTMTVRPAYFSASGGVVGNTAGNALRSGFVSLTTATDYFLNVKTDTASSTAIRLGAANEATIISAENAYL